MAFSGEFIRVTSPKGEMYGVFNSPSEKGVSFVTYDFGFPLWMDVPVYFLQGQVPSTIIDTSNVGETISKDFFLEGISKARQRLEQKLEQGGLVAACWASRMHCIDKVTEFLQDHSMLPLKFDYEEPSTGIYVAHTMPLTPNPASCGFAPEDLIEKGYHLQGVRVEPAIPSERLARVLANAFPKGFGAIPEGIYFNDKGLRGCLYGYFACHVPEYGVSYVENPLEFNFNPKEASAKPKKAAKKKAPKKKSKKKKKS